MCLQSLRDRRSSTQCVYVSQSGHWFSFQMKKIEDARKIYERLVTQFPNAGRYWKIYIEHEVNISHSILLQRNKPVAWER